MTLELEWEEPPAEALANPTQSTSFYAKVATALREKPGTWAKLKREFATEESARNTATRIRQGRVASMAKGEFEALGHGQAVWVRYIQPTASGDDGNVRPIKRASATHPPAAPSDAAKVREWARSKGMDVPKAGRLPQELIDQYDEENP